MTAVSMNRAEMSLKSVSGETIRSFSQTQNDTTHFDGKSVIMPLRNMANFSGSTGHRGGGGTATTAATGGGGSGGGCDQTSSTNRQPIGVNSHSYSSDSDVVPNTTATSSATAMRRLYFKSAKLNKTTSITTVHQQQAQHVPKVGARAHYPYTCDSINLILMFGADFFHSITKGYGDGIVYSVNCRNNHQYEYRVGFNISDECHWNRHIDM